MNATLRTPLAGYLATVGLTALGTALLVPFRQHVGLLNIGLLFLLLTLMISAIWGRAPGLIAALLTNLSLNFFFIEPLHHFTVQEPRNVGGLGIFLLVSVVGSSLLTAAKDAAGQARRRQAETQIALTMSREMSGQLEPEAALRQLCREATGAFDAPGAAVLKVGDGWSVLASAGEESAARVPGADERAVADRAASTGAIQGLGRSGVSQTRAPRIVFPAGRRAAYPDARSFAMVPLKVGDRLLGVLRLDGPIGDTPFRDHPEDLLSAIASEAALAIHRAELSQAAAHAEALREADELKTALLNAVSHDLRTPLASIIASAGSLQQDDVRWTDEERLSFAEAIEHEAQRLDRLVGNLLDLSRIESGSLRPEKGWYDLGPLVGEVLGRLKPTLAQHVVTTDLADNLPPVSLDYIEIDEVLTNLVENAIKYTPPGTEIGVSTRMSGDNVMVEVDDRGPGIPTLSLPHIFEPFYRVKGSKARGTGLGLAVARGLIEAHGGRIWAENRPDGGAKFLFTLPLDDGDGQPSSQGVEQTA
jgi:two-component system, OmpR family, sensor histidine kinase KdpD